MGNEADDLRSIASELVAVGEELTARAKVARRWTNGSRIAPHHGSSIQVTRTHTGGGVFTYHTHVVGAAGSAAALSPMGALLTEGPALSSQPWYAEFKSGCSVVVDPGAGGWPLALDSVHHQLCVVALFRGVERGWAQYCGRWGSSERQLVLPVVAASVLPPGAASPPGDVLRCAGLSGEVLTVEGDRLVWDHVVSSDRSGLAPARFDRWAMKWLRGVGLDTAERATYGREGGGFIQFTALPVRVEQFARAEAVWPRAH